ncbi:DNA binding protein [Bacillus phage YungSlug]|nr:DNA binding protein [Bacillus phage YungSlug]
MLDTLNNNSIIANVYTEEKGFSSLLEKIMCKKDLKTNSRLVLMSLLTYIRNSEEYSTNEFGEPEIEVSQNYIADTLGITVRTIQNMLTQLIDEGYLIVDNFLRVKSVNRMTLSSKVFGKIREVMNPKKLPNRIQVEAKKQLRKLQEGKENVRQYNISPDLMKEGDEAVAKYFSAVAKEEMKIKSERMVPMNIEEIAKQHGFSLTHTDKQIMAVAEYYSRLVAIKISKARYNALSTKDPKGHKNWVHFTRVHNICKENEWDFRLYLEIQFERVKYFKMKTKFPYVTTLYSEKAQNFFKMKLKDREETYATDMQKDTYTKGKNVMSQYERVVKAVEYQCDSLEMYVRKDESKNDFENGMKKLNYIHHSWTHMQPAYLYCVDFFREHMFPNFDVHSFDELDLKFYERLKEEFTLLEKSKTLRAYAMKTKELMETKFDIADDLFFHEETGGFMDKNGNVLWTPEDDN